MNTIILKGRLTDNPELKQTQSGVSVCSVDLAVNRSYAKQGEDRQADFFKIVCWRNTAEFISKYFVKGQEAIIKGEMQSRKYTDKEGNNRMAWEVQADSIEFCGSKGNGGAAQSDVPSPYHLSGNEQALSSEDDLTF